MGKAAIALQIAAFPVAVPGQGGNVTKKNRPTGNGGR